MNGIHENLKIAYELAVETVKNQMDSVDALDNKAMALQAACVLVLLFLVQIRSDLPLYMPFFFLACILLLVALLLAMWASNVQHWEDYPNVDEMQELAEGDTESFIVDVLASLKASIDYNDDAIHVEARRFRWATLAFVVGILVGLVSALLN